MLPVRDLEQAGLVHRVGGVRHVPPEVVGMQPEAGSEDSLRAQLDAIPSAQAVSDVGASVF